MAFWQLKPVQKHFYHYAVGMGKVHAFWELHFYGWLVLITNR
jgi:hypothetical protein